jgi:hypothetical protein
VTVVEVLRREHGGSPASECHSREMMNWQQVPPTYHGTLAPQLNPTSSGWLLPGGPTFSAQPGRARAQVETGQQVQEAGMGVQVKEQVVELVMQLVQEIPQLVLVRVRVQGSVIFQPELQLGPRETPAARVGHGHLCGVPQRAVQIRGEHLPKGQPKV